MTRPSKIENYLNVAKEIAQRSTCLRRNFGAVVTDQEFVVLSTGYNGAPRGTKNCIDLGYCARKEAKIPAGTRYELCRAGPNHAEVNSIINAARKGIAIKDSLMFLYGQNYNSIEPIDAEPCKMCKSQIINAGIDKVYTRRADRTYKTFVVEQWVADYPDKFDIDEQGY